MSVEVDALKLQRKWLSGGYTLLHALGLHHNEVYICRALAWLLRPLEEGAAISRQRRKALADINCAYPGRT
jgi:hypothetical protein